MHPAAAAEFTEASKDRTDRFLDAAVRIEAEANLPMPDIADRYAQPELTSLCLGTCGVQHSRPQNTEFEFTDTALHAQQQTIVRTTRITDTIEINDAGIDETAQLEEMMSVPPVAGETRGIKANHNADFAGAEPGDELLEAGARDGSARRPAEIVARRRAGSTRSYWRRRLSRWTCTCVCVDWRTYTTALRLRTAGGKGSVFVIADLLGIHAGSLHQQEGQTPNGGVAGRKQLQQLRGQHVASLHQSRRSPLAGSRRPARGR
jgi:hypothetical protein